MEYKFSQRAQNVPNAGIGAMMRYAAKYPEVVSLGQGTPLFPTPQFIYDYLYERSKMDPTIGQYSLPKIENELKTLIIQKIERKHGFTPKLEEIYLTVGGIGGLFSAIMAFLEKDDEVIYFDPSYPLHLSQIHLAQATPAFVSYNENNNWSIDLEKLEKAITSKTKMVILTNPNNPTGTVLNEAEVRRLSDIILKNNLILVLDEAYDFLTYGKDLFSPMQIPKLRNNLIVCKSFSKEFAMTGWRIGYVYANPEIIAKINDVHVYFSISPSTPSIVASIAALSDPIGEETINHFKIKFAESRQAICERLEKLPKLFSFSRPDGAYYVFPKIIGFDMPALDFAKMLVDEAKVITIPGDSMGPAGKNHLRMSFAADAKVIHEAFDRIDKFAQKHGLAT
ncbi:pyridoxal phosphate-dependent aminotransferase [Patescibacteria group bacterium]|nr:pyridoxal phosphate-dependent aminotransferase [Patescibacteria group bacterium]MBU1472213.1 pyridoxal phosphate-dependent aminotransferase [Patescibacteria group bacterium]MBU2459607.1 pyridoxal phosphate-dependent aminotransferase [Patescibacteria group bacterium]MBU2544527.1 pyridoxal phosphate-dependent aminotransferase [Patescibacteria group bacterium]